MVGHMYAFEPTNFRYTATPIQIKYKCQNLILFVAGFVGVGILFRRFKPFSIHLAYKSWGVVPPVSVLASVAHHADKNKRMPRSWNALNLNQQRSQGICLCSFQGKGIGKGSIPRVNVAVPWQNDGALESQIQPQVAHWTVMVQITWGKFGRNGGLPLKDLANLRRENQATIYDP